MEDKKNFYIKGILVIIIIQGLCFANTDTLHNTTVNSSGIDSQRDTTDISTVNNQDSLETAVPSREKQNEKKNKSRIVKHTFDYKQQIVLSLTTMVLLALIITSTQSWNPR